MKLKDLLAGVFAGVEVLEHMCFNYASIKFGRLGNSHFVCMFRVFAVFIQTQLRHLQCFQEAGCPTGLSQICYLFGGKLHSMHMLQ